MPLLLLPSVCMHMPPWLLGMLDVDMFLLRNVAHVKWAASGVSVHAPEHDMVICGDCFSYARSAATALRVYALIACARQTSRAFLALRRLPQTGYPTTMHTPQRKKPIF